jgi:hypothetical protein
LIALFGPDRSWDYRSAATVQQRSVSHVFVRRAVEESDVIFLHRGTGP